MTKTKKRNFEQSLALLEEIVAGLDTGKFSLEEGLKKFEEGVNLYQECKEILDHAEKKITVLTKTLKEEKF